MRKTYVEIDIQEEKNGQCCCLLFTSCIEYSVLKRELSYFPFMLVAHNNLGYGNFGDS